MQFIFPNKEALAEHLEEKAKGIRSRVPTASRNQQHVMRAEAHAYEQSAMMIRNAEFTDVAQLKEEANELWHQNHPERMGQ